MDDELYENTPQIEAPEGLLPDLDDWGITPEAPGVCIDTAENRRLIRENKARFIDVYATDGSPTNLIQVVTEEMRTVKTLATKSAILTDPRNPDSDYETGLDLLLISNIENYIPTWVLRAAKHWQTVAKERERREDDARLRADGVPAKPYRPYLAGPPTRCRALTLSGSRCKAWTNGLVDYDGLCRTHQGSSIQRYGESTDAGPGHVMRARNRILSAASAAADGLEAMMYDEKAPPAVRLKAQTEILDRAGVRGGFEITSEVEVTVKPAVEILNERLTRLKKAQAYRAQIESGEVVDAEIVDDAPERIQGDDK